MSDSRTRLVRCFAAVFPDLSSDEIEVCSQETVPAWDSVQAITLVNVIDEEFCVAIDFDLLPELSSFRTIAQYLEQLLRPGSL